MRLLPEILAERRGAEGMELDLRVPEDLGYFAGHFPGLPILPGVVQIDWTVKLARERLGVRGDFVSADNLKFLSIVRPGAGLTLVLRREASRLGFAYQSAERKVSSGTLTFRDAA